MDRATKKQLIKACKVNEPVPPGDPHHFDFDTPELRLRGPLWRERVAKVIALSDEKTAQLVTGLSGSGKSTELKQLHHDLEADGFQVVLADAGAWIRDDQPITTRDILLALVLALYPSGQPDTMAGWAQEYANQVWEFLNSEAKLPSLGLKGGPAQVKVELTTHDTLFQEVARRLGELRSFRERVFGLLDSAARKADTEERPLVVVLDGLEKRATGDLAGTQEQETYRNHWFGAFLTDARDLQPPIHVVYTVPPFMIRRAPEIGSGFGTELQFLPMVRVLDRDLVERRRPRLHLAGIRALCDALHLRVPVRYFNEPGIVPWLAVHSGGYIRDLLRLVIECIYQVPEGATVTREHAEEAIIRVRQSYRESLELEARSLLKQVYEQRDFPRDTSNRRQMDALLQGHLMLRFHNAVSWYDVHPLLWHLLDIEGPSWEDVARVCP